MEYSINIKDPLGISPFIRTVNDFPIKGIKFKEIGIRPGEKLHELLCPFDENIRTFEFNDFFVIGPTTNQYKNLDYSTTANNEKGKPVGESFEYNSLNNPHYLNAEQIIELLKENNLI